MTSVVLGFPLAITVKESVGVYLVAPKDEAVAGSLYKTTVGGGGEGDALYGTITATAKFENGNEVPVSVNGREIEFMIPEDASGQITLEVRVDGELVEGSGIIGSVKPRHSITWLPQPAGNPIYQGDLVTLTCNVTAMTRKQINFEAKDDKGEEQKVKVNWPLPIPGVKIFTQVVSVDFTPSTAGVWTVTASSVNQTISTSASISLPVLPLPSVKVIDLYTHHQAPPCLIGEPYEITFLVENLALEMVKISALQEDGTVLMPTKVQIGEGGKMSIQVIPTTMGKLNFRIDYEEDSVVNLNTVALPSIPFIVEVKELKGTWRVEGASGGKLEGRVGQPFTVPFSSDNLRDDDVIHVVAVTDTGILVPTTTQKGRDEISVNFQPSVEGRISLSVYVKEKLFADPIEVSFLSHSCPSYCPLTFQ